MSTPSASSNDGTTVRFNVGGKMYHVSKSLLEQHSTTMLARMASDTWRPTKKLKTSNDKSDSSEIFIERNGDRFQYVLDYMRDGGTLSLPVSVSKNALLQDLTYYGFEDVDASQITIDVTVQTYEASRDHIESSMEAFETELKDLEKKLETDEQVLQEKFEADTKVLEERKNVLRKKLVADQEALRKKSRSKRNLLSIAADYLQNFKAGDSLQMYFHVVRYLPVLHSPNSKWSYSDNPKYQVLKEVRESEEMRAEFDAILGTVGLKVKEITDDNRFLFADSKATVTLAYL